MLLPGLWAASGRHRADVWGRAAAAPCWLARYEQEKTHWAVAEENAVRVELQHLLGGIPGRHDRDAAVVRGQAAHDVVLDAKVIGHDLRSKQALLQHQRHTEVARTALACKPACCLGNAARPHLSYSSTNSKARGIHRQHTAAKIRRKPAAKHRVTHVKRPAAVGARGLRGELPLCCGGVPPLVGFRAGDLPYEVLVTDRPLLCRIDQLLIAAARATGQQLSKGSASLCCVSRSLAGL